MARSSRARNLARLAALHGRWEFERGSPKAGRADSAAIMALGRHVGRDPVMISVLVRYLIEGLAVDLAYFHTGVMREPWSPPQSGSGSIGSNASAPHSDQVPS